MELSEEKLLVLMRARTVPARQDDAQSVLRMPDQDAEVPLRTPEQDRDALLREGFLSMGWPAYDSQCICRTPEGKPYVKVQGNADLRTGGGKGPAQAASYAFNYSDAKTYCAAAFSTVPVGIDIEETRHLGVHLLRRLPFEEQKYLFDARDDAERNLRFLRIWTAKEAFGKMAGTGLTQEILETDFASISDAVLLQSVPAGPAGTSEVRIRPVPMVICGTPCLFGQACMQTVVISVVAFHG